MTNLHKLYPDQFDKIGNFHGEAQLHLNENVQLYISAPRKCSIHMRDKIKSKLGRMEQSDVIRKVTEHTDWCSNVGFTERRDGSIRVCLDPRKSNKNNGNAVHRKYQSWKEKLNPKFANAKVFSKLDAKTRYWSVKRDEKSQPLTTCWFPLGSRYCFFRLPFGLINSQDIFQNQIDKILSLTGVASIAYDWQK